jgi:dipeptidase
MDYGSLIYTTLQRASTAREAISIMDELTNEYGYYSSAEGFSITDGTEVRVGCRVCVLVFLKFVLKDVEV